jgi:hypothetical protein
MTNQSFPGRDVFAEEKWYLMRVPQATSLRIWIPSKGTAMGASTFSE